MKNNVRNQKGFVSLLGLLFAIAIICFVAYKIYNAYLAKPTTDQETQKALKEQGMDTRTQQGAYDSAKEKIQGVKEIMHQQGDDLLNAIQQ